MRFRPAELAHYVRSDTHPRAAHTTCRAVIPLRGITARHAVCRRCGAPEPPRNTTPRAPMRYSLPRMPPSQRGGAPALRFPPSVFPLWKPPFQIPPLKADSTKGGKPQGATARRPFWKTAQNRRGVGGFSQRRFRPPPYGGPAPPPLNQPRCARPQSWGQRVGRAESGCGRSGPRTLPALQGRRVRGVDLPPKTLRGGFRFAPQNPPRPDPATVTPARKRLRAVMPIANRPKRMRTTFPFSRQVKRGAERKSCFQREEA